MGSGARLRADGAWTVTPDAAGRARVAYAVTDAADAVWVHIDGHVLVLESPRPRARSRTDDGTGLEAPMPAQVTAVLVAPGDEVERGAPLLLLEAMKMELPMRAPFDGRVDAVHCAVGDRVAPGRALVALTARETP